MTDNNAKPVADMQARPDSAGELTQPSAVKNESVAELLDDGSTEAQATPKGMTEEDANLGYALRSIYQQTVEEAIPDEMLNLLNRLG